MGTLLQRCRKQASKTHADWSRRAVIYELNTRQFSPDGNFAGVSAQLARLEQLGVDVIWFMPIFPIGAEMRKGTLGSYYSIRDYRAVNPEFGTLDEFKSIVNEAHNCGMRVILDWVPNHTSRDAVWTQNLSWYKHNPLTGEIDTPFDWTDTAQLDYDSIPMRMAMVDAMKFWLKEADIDGFRVDMAMLEPIDFWNATIPELEKARPDIFMLAEAEGPEFHNIAFDATYTWELHHAMTRIARGEGSLQELRDRLSYEASIYSPDAYRMMFTSNHDENSWNGSEFQRFGQAARGMAVLTYILPGIPLIYNGQEIGSGQQLQFFDRDPINWDDPDSALVKLYSDLNHLRHSQPALYGGQCGGDLYNIDNSAPDKVLSLKRIADDNVVLGLFNFSGDHVDLEFYDQDFEGNYQQLGSEELALLHSGSHFYLPPWGFYVYYKG